MLYHTQSPYFRQFLASTTTKKYIKSLEKANQPAGEARGNVNPGSVGV